MHTQPMMTTCLISAHDRMQYVSGANINLIMNAVYIYVYNNANDNPQAKMRPFTCLCHESFSGLVNVEIGWYLDPVRPL